MTWEQAVARANTLAGRDGLRRTVRACRLPGLDGPDGPLCACGLWWVDRA